MYKIARFLFVIFLTRLYCYKNLGQAFVAFLKDLKQNVTTFWLITFEKAVLCATFQIRPESGFLITDLLFKFSTIWWKYYTQNIGYNS